MRIATNVKVYKSPSIDAMVKGLKISKEKAAELKGLMHGTTDPNNYESVKSQPLFRRKNVSHIAKVLEALNEALGYEGTRSFKTAKGFVSPYWGDARIVYLNAGNPYKTTLLYDTKRRYFWLGCWSELYEGYAAARYKLI